MERRAHPIIGLLVVASLARLLSLWFFHPLNWDEIEYFRAADWIRQGLVPYRDFWEHHTPLQWFVFAPLTALVRNDTGATAILAMRLLQVPLWALTFWALWRWMRNAGVEVGARGAAIAIAICSSFFMLAAVEFRVDTLSCALFAVGLLLLQERKEFLAGFVFCLAGFANIRLGPLLVMTMVLAAVVNVRWGADALGGDAAPWLRRATSILGGAFVALACCALYFLVTRSVGAAIQSVWSDNYIAEKLAPAVPRILLHRIAGPFGLRLIARQGAHFALGSIDPATIVIFIVGAIGVIRTLVAKWRAPDDWFFLALLQVVDVAFIARMKFLYNYHFEIVILLMLPFMAAALGRLKPAATLTFVTLLVLINIGVVLFRGKEDDLAYQDLIMREVHRSTPANGKVFDGVGWAIRRPPAYRYWFLRAIVDVMEKNGRFEPYRITEPPAAFISDFGARVWLATHPDLRRYFTSHYLPTWRDLWLPGMSGTLAPGEQREWIVPADGDYRVYASPQLALHPWFRDPIATGSYARVDAHLQLSMFHNDAQFASGPGRRLRRGERFFVKSRDSRPFGVFVVPAERTELFRQPPRGVDLDAAFPPVTHVPRFRP